MPALIVMHGNCGSFHGHVFSPQECGELLPSQLIVAAVHARCLLNVKHVFSDITGTVCVGVTDNKDTVLWSCLNAKVQKTTKNSSRPTV